MSRITDPKSIESVKNTIESLKGMIAKAKAIKNGDKDALKHAMDMVREWEYDAGVQKDIEINKATTEGAVKAHGWMRMQLAYQNIITLFEKPEDMMNSNQRDIEFYEEWLRKAERNQSARTEPAPAR